jgi:tRNA/tmRNA/rRNA uracil-C5-methylase (TrmA/RlmC/RlmD family)
VTAHLDELVEVSVERPALGGAVGRLEDGRVIFVRLALPGERVRARVSELRPTYARAEAIDVLAASPERVDPPCAHAAPERCGGCDLQQLSTAAQHSWKREIVVEHLRAIARVDWAGDVDAVGDARGSRTRLRCAVGADGRLGLRRARRHELEPLDACWIADDRLQVAFGRSWTGASEVELRAIGDGAPFAVVRRGPRSDESVELADLDGRAIPLSTSSVVTVAGFAYRVGARSFWQSHRDAPVTLVEHVVRTAKAGVGDHVVDLYCGVGLFAVALAEAVGTGGRVDAVESSAPAIDDLAFNARRQPQLRVRPWRVAARSVHDLVGGDSVVVVDPPRTGLGRGVADALVRRRPRRLIYVSCDSATFARDVEVLQRGPFELTELRVIDLFPMTEHVELVGVLDATG